MAGERVVVLKHSVAVIGTALVLCMTSIAASGASPPEPARKSEGDYVTENFRFASGETLPELRMHYTTLGAPHRNSRGHVDNAVLILHGLGGSGHSLLADRFAGVLFGKGQPLDAGRYYLILPDALGSGQSSKPSDGLHARFPKYVYEDMVGAQYALLSQGLQVDHLRAVIGMSMGCMQTWTWGETHSDFVDALMPIACLPIAVTGRDRLWRSVIIDAIRSDPEWQQGEYTSEPLAALRTAAGVLLIAGSAALQMQAALPTAEAADTLLHKYLERQLKELDANDLLYEINASRTVDRAAALEQIRVPVMWVNSADDFVTPPELGIAEREIKRLKNGRFVLLPSSDQTHGHGTAMYAVAWQQYLVQLLALPAP